MKIEEVPEGHWMLLDKNRNVLFHCKKCGDVVREGKKHPLGDVYIETKMSNYFFGLTSAIKTRG